MLDHVAGNLSPPFALAGDVHLLLSPEGTDMASLWSMVGGTLLEDRGSLSQARLPAPRRRKTYRRSSYCAEDVLRQAESGPKWKRGLSGVRYAPTGIAGARFLMLGPGESAPTHGHGDLEATVVIAGSYSDGCGTYQRGDLALADRGMRHKPMAVGDETCVCLVANGPNSLWRRFI